MLLGSSRSSAKRRKGMTPFGWTILAFSIFLLLGLLLLVAGLLWDRSTFWDPIPAYVARPLWLAHAPGH